jgi:two-component system sensor histidine kinase ChvG
VFETRRDILKVFSVTLLITVLLSIYLAGSIARPIRQLAAAAERVRRDHSRRHKIPDMARRNDEIGELAGSLKDMTEALWLRMDAIESFAADVAHEIKNPLTSLRSAVETTARLKDPEQQRKLMVIIQEDVTRLDRLISDISDASRLDAELSRAETGDVDLTAMLETLADIHNSTQTTGHPVQLQAKASLHVHVAGMEGRLAQVFRNLISNAQSFSPEDGAILVSLTTDGAYAVVQVDDDGRGIPAGKESAIFERFYTERPGGEKFGTHSGLGLSISRQIVEAHGGSIAATNRTGADGNVQGARFTVRLPLAQR